ncbi:MAG: mechanosensitive ion channel family protein [Dysgonamonadaceae bacterium]|jgi:miniconductance mechanosensitive channel|nr:mechanosensitive ion channel family protein [Dysgonamonadaceae bacterium]
MNEIVSKQQDIEQITKSTNIVSEWSVSLLKSCGIADNWIKYINMLIILALLIVLVFVLQYLTRVILSTVFNRLEKMPQTKFFGRLKHRRFPHYLAMIIPFSLVKGSIPIIFEAFPRTMHVAGKLTDIYLIFYVIWLIMSVVNAFGDTLKKKPGLNDKPVESYIQVVKIFFYFIGFIILFSILSGKNPMYFIGGLGAASAILLLIFKDTIMGFVASIQVSVNDMVRIGDWITMPKYGADGDVIQITLSTVKIRNFDKTIVTIPPYSLVSESFQNWRGMQESGGRRLKRDIFVNQSDIYFLNAEELEEMKKVEGLKKYIEERQPRLDKLNSGLDLSVPVNGYHITNCDLFMQYAVWILKNHPDINQNMTLMVRTLAPTPEGLPIEIYTFTNTTVWVDYEKIIAEITGQILASLPFFKLRVYTTTASDPYDIYLHNTAQGNAAGNPDKTFEVN